MQTPTLSASEIETFVQQEGNKRKPFERRWYNNNFFDDGYHYRFVSRSTGRVVDLASSQDTFIPYRAIPKASRQIRGVANLLLANDFLPVVYPEPIMASQFPDPTMFEQAREAAAKRAKRLGRWVQTLWEEKDVMDQIALMVLLTAKHGVSYMQIAADADNEDIGLSVWDAFDWYVSGEKYSVYDSPIIVKAVPKLASEIKNNKNFDEMQRLQLNPDNKYASSEIKEAYMVTRFGYRRATDETATLILKEAYKKEDITDENREKVQEDLGRFYKNLVKGQKVIRQVYSSAGVWLSDKYVSLPEYNIVDFRMEPGPIYQVPLIERFIPANKILDSVMSRIERYIGTMVVGAYLKRRGENVMISNLSGGQMLEYDQTPPQQMQTATLGNYIFAFIKELNDIIEEQGASTSALGDLPPGVKSGVAIESLKATEYANLKINSNQLKKCIRMITRRMIDVAANYYVTPRTVNVMENAQPESFSVIGEAGMEKYKELADKKGSGISVPDALTIKRNYHVDIEVDSGMGYTAEGKKQTMIQIIDYLSRMAQMQVIPPQALQVILKRFLEIFEFGNVKEFMDAIDNGSANMTEEQLAKIKIALAETLKDAEVAGPKARENRIMEGKVATIESLKEAGLIDKMRQGSQNERKEQKSAIKYDKAPADIRRQIEAREGLQPSQSEPIAPAQADVISTLRKGSNV